jgi:O-antigen ligase
MIAAIATIVVAALIASLFYLGRDEEAHTSKGLWIPVIWMLIVGSRAVSEWWTQDTVKGMTDRYTEGSPVDAAIYAVLIVAGLLVLNSRSRKVASTLRANGPLLLFFCYCAISLLWSDDPFVAAKRLIKGIGDVVMVLVILTDGDPVGAVKRFFSRVAFILSPMSVLLIVGFPQYGTLYNKSAGAVFYNGVTTQKNELGLICLVCGLGSLWSWIDAYENHGQRHRGRQLIAQSVSLLLALCLIKVCDSMTSFSCFVISAAVMILSGRPWVLRQTRNVHFLVGGAIALAVFAAFIDSSGVLLRMLGRNPTLTGRTDIWKAVLSFHTNPIIGTGYDSFWLGGRIEKVWQIIGYKGISQAHNGYLQVYLELGLIGVALWAWLAANGYRSAVSVLRVDPLAGRFRLAFITAGLIYSLAEAGFRAMMPIWVVFLLATTSTPFAEDPRQSENAAGLMHVQLGAGQRRFRVLQ